MKSQHPEIICYNCLDEFKVKELEKITVKSWVGQVYQKSVCKKCKKVLEKSKNFIKFIE